MMLPENFDKFNGQIIRKFRGKYEGTNYKRHEP